MRGLNGRTGSMSRSRIFFKGGIRLNIAQLQEIAEEPLALRALRHVGEQAAGSMRVSALHECGQYVGVVLSVVHALRTGSPV